MKTDIAAWKEDHPPAIAENVKTVVRQAI